MNSVTMWKYSLSINSRTSLSGVHYRPVMLRKIFQDTLSERIRFLVDRYRKDANFANYRYIYFDNADFPYNYTARMISEHL